MSATYNLVLIKPGNRRLREEPVSGNAVSIVTSSVNPSHNARGWGLEFAGWDAMTWTYETAAPYYPEGTELQKAKELNLMRLTLTYNYHEEQIKGDLAGILLRISSKSQTPAYGGWTLATVNGELYREPQEGDLVVEGGSDLLGYVDVAVPDNWDEYFSHLYGLEPHIRRLRRSIETAIRTGWKKRLSVVLVGDPGCGKSDIAESMIRALGEGACWRMDATATTAAGTIKELANKDILPRIMVLEEAEKASEKVTEPFLGILDQRGEINKTTARDQIQRQTKLLCVSTVNDYAKFKAMNAGALESRHPVKIFFKRPSRDTLTLILVREIHQMPNGDPAWINPCLDYCEKEDITDPREIISHCLNGAEDWLTGEYVKDLEATSPEAATEA